MKRVTLWSSLGMGLLLLVLLYTGALAQGPGGPGVLGVPTSYPTRRAGQDRPGEPLAGDGLAINALYNAIFIDRLLSGYEVKQGQTPAIQALAKDMAKRYADTQQQLEDVARRMRQKKAAQVSLGDDDQSALVGLTYQTGADFENRYLDLLILNQRNLLSLLEHPQDEVSNPNLRDFQRKLLPMAAADLKTIEQLTNGRKTSASPAEPSVP